MLRGLLEGKQPFDPQKEVVLVDYEEDKIYLYLLPNYGQAYRKSLELSVYYVALQLDQLNLTELLNSDKELIFSGFDSNQLIAESLALYNWNMCFSTNVENN
jgi:hypothetical protein